ncbi:four helix bundle protein [candidate division KSB1 bacterium]|nr:four helix bundle protein [candidate division KSB1 bacterium]
MSYTDSTEMPVWQEGFRLLVEIYTITKDYPKEEKFGLTADMRRAAHSIVHNIAEGFGRFEAKDKTRFYKISRGSCFELMSQLMVSNALFYLKKSVSDNHIKTCRKIIEDLNSLIKTVETR